MAKRVDRDKKSRQVRELRTLFTVQLQYFSANLPTKRKSRRSNVSVSFALRSIDNDNNNWEDDYKGALVDKDEVTKRAVFHQALIDAGLVKQIKLLSESLNDN